MIFTERGIVMTVNHSVAFVVALLALFVAVYAVGLIKGYMAAQARPRQGRSRQAQAVERRREYDRHAQR